jgi:hypothetical protein
VFASDSRDRAERVIEIVEALIMGKSGAVIDGANHSDDTLSVIYIYFLYLVSDLFSEED